MVNFNYLLKGNKWESNRKSQQRPLTILKLLAFHPNGIHQDALTDLLWKDADGDLVIQLLHTTLHRLRKILNSHDAVTLKNGLLCLSPPLVKVDLSTFNKLSIKPFDTVKVALIEYKKISEYYSLGILPDEQEASWLISIREEIKADYLKYLYRLAAFMNIKGRKAESIGIYRQFTILDPYSEKSYQALIELYINEGLNAEAMQVYQQCETVLKQQFDIKPSEKTYALISKL